MQTDATSALTQGTGKAGLLEPIWIHEGMILDGRHRYYACQEVSVTPQFREYEGADPVSFVVSLNLKRRHLNEGQRAIVAAKMANLSNGVRSDRSSANLQGLPPVTQPQAAALSADSRWLQRNACAQIRHQRAPHQPLTQRLQQA